MSTSVAEPAREFFKKKDAMKRGGLFATVVKNPGTWHEIAHLPIRKRPWLSWTVEMPWMKHH